MSEQWMSVTVVVAIDESPAVGDVPVMVVYQVVVVPIGSPVMPAPAKPSEDANSHAERNPWPLDEGARNPDPSWIERERVPVDDPRIIFRHINDFRVRWFNHDRLSLGRDGLLLRALQVPGLLRSLTHHLNCVKDILLSVHVRIPEGRGPGQTLVHHGKHRRKLRESLYTGIPGLRIDRLGECVSLQIWMLLYPALSLHDFRRIGRGCKDLRDQSVRVQCDRCDQPVQFFGRLLRHHLSALL